MAMDPVKPVHAPMATAFYELTYGKSAPYL